MTFSNDHPVCRIASSFAMTLALSAGLIAAPPRAPGGSEKQNLKLRHVFLVDVSGSMKSSLGSPGSGTRRFFGEHLTAIPGILEDGQPCDVYSFSTAKWQMPPHYKGPHKASRLRQILENEIQITSHDTDMVHALSLAEGALGTLARDEIGLVWMLTDNINDPSGSGGDTQETRRFYEALFHEGTALQRMYFFPMKDQKLVLYLMVHGQDPALNGIDIEQFEKALGRVGTGIAAPRIRAKPVGGENPLEIDRNIQFQSDESAHVSAEVIGNGRNRVLVIHGLREGKPLVGHFRLRIRSRFDEWRIEDAHIEQTQLADLESAEFPNISGKLSARLTPDRVSVNPQGMTTVTYSLSLGADESLTPKARFFNFSALSPDKTGTVSAKLIVRIGNPQLKLQIFNDPATTEAVRNVFHLEDIEYFLPRSGGSREARLDFQQPVQFEVGYNWLPRWLALIGAVTVPGVAFFLLGGVGRKAVYCRLLGYQEEAIPLSGSAQFPIAPQGTAIAVLTRSTFGDVVCKPSPDVLLNGQRGAVKVKNGAQIQLQVDERSYIYTVEIVRAPSAGTGASSKQASAGYY